MTSAVLPLHRARWSAPARSDRFSAEKPEFKVSKGTHHLLVALHLRLAHRNGFLTALLALCVVSLGAATVLVAFQAGHIGSPLFSQSAAVLEPHRVLLATHNRLAWYYPLQDTFKVLHEGEGVHYGMFPGDPLPGHPHTVWNIIRPHNWRPTTNKEHLVMFDADTGMELQRVEIPSRFSHDAVRVGDRVYVCSTGNGTILELSYPNMALLRSMPLFSEADHPNTLAAADDEGLHLWVLLHNLGESDLVKVYVGPDHEPHEVLRIASVGSKAHGLVAWGMELLLLDSDSGALVTLDVETGDVFDLYMVPEESKFLKGLTVVDDIAYFGITTWAERSVRDSPTNHGELAAFDLVKGKLLWRRTVPTAGLLNIIGAPHLAADSTYAATYSGSASTELMRLSASKAASNPVVLPDSDTVVQRAVDILTEEGYPPRPIDPADYWSSGWPRLNPEPKLTDAPDDAGLQLPLFHANISALQAQILALPDAIWSPDHQALHNVATNGRKNNMDRFKPGVEGIVLIFSDGEGNVVYEFPFYEVLRQDLEPLLLEILGPVDINNIIRLQLARMAPGESDIKTHQDMGGYAINGHRIHIPITTHPLVSFTSCPDGEGNAANILQGLAAAAAAATGRAAAGNARQAVAGASLRDIDLQGALEHGAGLRRLQQIVADAAPETDQQQGQQQEVQQAMPRPRELLRATASAAVSAYYGVDSADGLPGEDMEQQQHLLLQQQEQQPTHSSRHDSSLQANRLSTQPPATATAASAGAAGARGTLQQQQQQQRRQQMQQLKLHRQRPCVKLHTPEGLVFELNNRVPHKVSNPAKSNTTRIHLVIDVVEQPRVRTPLPPGTACEYGRVPVKALKQLQQVLTSTEPGQVDVEAVTAEIRALVASPGMTCVSPEGRRIMPVRKSRLSAVELDEIHQQEEMVQELLAQLQGLAPEGGGVAGQA